MRREIFNELEAWIKPLVRKPLIVWGVKGCGKKHALVHFGKEYFERVFHINFAKMQDFKEVFSGKFDPNRILDEIELYFGIEIDLGKHLILLSEIQECPGIEDVILSFARLRSKLAICCIAPSRQMEGLGKEIILLQMRPMNFREFMAAINDKKAIRIYQNLVAEKRSVEWSHRYLLDLFKKYLLVGGMPEVVLKYKESGDYGEVREIQKKIMTEMLDDIEAVRSEANGVHMKSIVLNMVSQMREQQGGRVGKFSFKGVLPGSSARLSRIEKSIEWLRRHGFVYVINIQNNLEKIEGLNKGFKLYFFDVGILSSLIGVDILASKGFRGLSHLLENHVVLALSGEREELFSWRGTNAEVSFVRDLDGMFIPNDVREAENLRAKNLKAFAEIHQPSFVIKTTDLPLRIDRKTREVNLPYYLAEFEW